VNRSYHLLVDADTPSEKTPFLVCYDYGMGGPWAVIDARNESEIAAKYPEVTVVHSLPEWMDAGRYEAIYTTRRYDVDGEPSGMLEAVLADRQRNAADA
jgi:hypothetical protein